MANMLQGVLEKTRNYGETKCDKKGFPRQNNLSKIEKEGLRSLQTKVKRAELVVQATDKSKKLAFCSIESYNKSMQPHVNDPTISWEEQRQLERQLNGHTLQFGRLLRLGKAWGDNHVARVKSALRPRTPLNHLYMDCAKITNRYLLVKKKLAPHNGRYAGPQSHLTGP